VSSSKAVFKKGDEGKGVEFGLKQFVQTPNERKETGGKKKRKRGENGGLKTAENSRKTSSTRRIGVGWKGNQKLRAQQEKREWCETTTSRHCVQMDRGATL